MFSLTHRALIGIWSHFLDTHLQKSMLHWWNMLTEHLALLEIQPLLLFINNSFFVHSSGTKVTEQPTSPQYTYTSESLSLPHTSEQFHNRNLWELTIGKQQIRNVQVKANSVGLLYTVKKKCGFKDCKNFLVNSFLNKSLKEWESMTTTFRKKKQGKPSQWISIAAGDVKALRETLVV